MAAKYPIREWLGKYSSFMLKLYGRNSAWFREGKIERFLSYFPDANCVTDIRITDTTDYKTFRSGKGVSPRTVEIELRCLRDWYSWMAEDCDLPVHNPVSEIKPHKSRLPKENRLSLEELKRLLECSEFDLRVIILEIAGGERNINPRGWQKNRMLREATQQANLPWIKGFAILRHAINGLWKQVIEREYPKLRDTFLLEVKPGCNSTADIKTSVLNEWASVYDFSDIT